MDAAVASGLVSPKDSVLVELARDCYYDPLTWVHAIYPWGKPGTFLADKDGPDSWQEEALQAIGVEAELVDQGKGATNAVQVAIRSGHGIGKTAFSSWVIQWWLSTRRDPAMNVTSGTDAQLKTRLWRELAKWHAVSHNAHWFDWTATSFRLKRNPLAVANAIPWSENNPHALAGLHEGDPCVVFDEASIISQNIWDTLEGAFTTPGGMWLVIGNPTEQAGGFSDCFGDKAKYWRQFTVDSRTAKMADKTRINQWLEQYGEDSDFFRVRVRGLPPRGGETRLFTVDLIEKAQKREMEEEWITAEVPLIMGVDPAGGGASLSAIALRRGPLVKPDGLITFSEHDQMRVVSVIASHISRWRPDYVFIDAHGIGKPIYDRLRELGFNMVTAVYGGDRAQLMDKFRYYNPRAEWWGRMAEWMRVSKIPQHPELRKQLLAQPMETKNMRLQLMDKADMRKHGIPSPDVADALSYTFAELVASRRDKTSLAMEGGLPDAT